MFLPQLSVESVFLDDSSVDSVHPLLEQSGAFGEQPAGSFSTFIANFFTVFWRMSVFFSMSTGGIKSILSMIQVLATGIFRPIAGMLSLNLFLGIATCVLKFRMSCRSLFLLTSSSSKFSLGSENAVLIQIQAVLRVIREARISHFILCK